MLISQSRLPTYTTVFSNVVILKFGNHLNFDINAIAIWPRYIHVSQKLIGMRIYMVWIK